MPFEFAFLDWLYQFRNPVMNTISIFFDYAGAHGEIWIAFTLLLLLFRRTRKAGFAMAVALVLYMAAGHFFLKPLFARPRPCDINTSITMLVARPHGHSFPSGHTASGVAAAYALWLQNRKLGTPALVLAVLSPLPGCTSMCTFPPMSLAARCWASHWALRPPHLQTIWQIAKRNNKLYKKRSLHKCVQRPFFYYSAGNCTFRFCAGSQHTSSNRLPAGRAASGLPPASSA